MVFWSLIRISWLESVLPDVCLVICQLEVVFQSGLCGRKLMGLHLLAPVEISVADIVIDLALAVIVKFAGYPD